MRLLMICLLGICALYGTRDPVIEWNDQTLEAIRQEQTEAPVAARNLALVHLAIYDAVNAIDGLHTPYHLSPEVGPDADVNVAVTAAAHRVLLALYPEQSSRFDTLLLKQYQAVPDSFRKKEGIRVGREVAEALLRWRQDDGATRTGQYYFSRQSGDWIPTSQFREQPLLPLWGHVNPFCVKPLGKFQIEEPPEITSEQYAKELEQVYHLGGEDSLRRTPEQTEIALFWSDRPGTATPVGRWNEITQGLAVKYRNTVSQNAHLFALLNLALADAGITCWRCKYEHRRWRPLSAIHYAATDGNTRTRKDEDWEPLLKTPMTPEYGSSHSAFGGAAEVVLTAFFGDRVSVTVPTQTAGLEARIYSSVHLAAEEAAQSRVYGGVQFSSGKESGPKLGRQVGTFVVETELLPKKRTVMGMRR